MTDNQKDAIQSASAALVEAERLLFSVALDGRMSEDRKMLFRRHLQRAVEMIDTF